jgi:hypothetical protein
MDIHGAWQELQYTLRASLTQSSFVETLSTEEWSTVPGASVLQKVRHQVTCVMRKVKFNRTQRGFDHEADGVTNG